MALLGYCCCCVLFALVYFQKNRGRSSNKSFMRKNDSASSFDTLQSSSPGKKRNMSTNNNVQYAFDEDGRDENDMNKPLIDQVRGTSSNSLPNSEASSDSGGWGESLMYHPSIGLFLGLSVPIVIICTIILLLVANLTPGAQVGLQVRERGRGRRRRRGGGARDKHE